MAKFILEVSIGGGGAGGGGVIRRVSRNSQEGGPKI